MESCRPSLVFLCVTTLAVCACHMWVRYRSRRHRRNGGRFGCRRGWNRRGRNRRGSQSGRRWGGWNWGWYRSARYKRERDHAQGTEQNLGFHLGSPPLPMCNVPSAQRCEKPIASSVAARTVRGCESTGSLQPSTDWDDIATTFHQNGVFTAVRQILTSPPFTKPHRRTWESHP